MDARKMGSANRVLPFSRTSIKSEKQLDSKVKSAWCLFKS